MLIKKLQFIKPQKVLDIGCGCGEFTNEISQYCGHITAIDVSKHHIERCRKSNCHPNIEFICLDGRNTGFKDKSFDCVIERASLHHMKNWESAINEMFRLSKRYVLVTEPLDSERNPEKRNLNAAQDLYLEVQQEAAFEHYRHLREEILISFFMLKGVKYECLIERYEDIVEFDEYFNMYNYFAEKTSRIEYWNSRLNEFKKNLNGGNFCRNDVINIFCEI